MTIGYDKALPVEAQCEVLVCGAGPAGIAAAVSAARQGKHTVLLERYGAVGGCLTLGCVSPIMGRVASGTIAEEITALLSAGDDRNGIDPEYAKLQLTRLLHREGVTFRLQTPVFDVLKEGAAVIGVAAATPRGPVAFLGARVIDCTGDGQVASLAGAEVMVGRPGDGLVQPMSLMYIIEGVEQKNTLVCRHETDYTTLKDGREYLALCKAAAADGRLPEHVTIVRLYPTGNPGERVVNATQENGRNALNAGDLEKAEVSLREQMERVNHFLRAEIPGFSNIRTRVSASAMGVRETRRIRGLYLLDEQDIAAGSAFPDVVVHQASFCFDTHNPKGGGQAEAIEAARAARPYDIPMRCLQPLQVERLIVAGRCISGTHKAHSSYRVMNICMAMGQAAGVMAASSLDRNVPVAEIDARDVQRRLAQAGCRLFD